MSSRQPPAGEALGQTRIGLGIREVEISDWTCFSCGGRLTQAHEGDYFHTDDDSTCFDPIPVPTSLVEPSPQDKAPSSARECD